MRGPKRATLVAVVLSLAAVVGCLAGVWGEYRVARSEVPSAQSLRAAEGVLESCEVELHGLLGPLNLLHGAWNRPATYLFTLRGIDARFRTAAFKCGVGTAAIDGNLGQPYAVTFNTPVRPVDTTRGLPPLYNAYGWTVNGAVVRDMADDLADHRRAHDVIARINIVGLLLLAIVLPGLLLGALRGRLWRESETDDEQQDDKPPVVSQGIGSD